MTDYENRQISELSGGQLQRIFMPEPWLKVQNGFLDEPFVGIDAVSEKKILLFWMN